jgi:hypothetical protein
MNGKQIASFLMVSVLVAAGMIALITFTAPEAEGQVYHLLSTGIEDNDIAYDIDPTVGVVEWDPAEPIHIIDDAMGAYIVDPGFTLKIPGGAIVQFEGSGVRIDVFGTLLTQDDGSGFTFTTFSYSGFGTWLGINVFEGGQIALEDSVLDRPQDGLIMSSGSELLDPGILNTQFVDFGINAVVMDGVTGVTKFDTVTFDDRDNPSGTAVSIENGEVEMVNTPTFLDRGPNKPFIYMRNATVDIQEVGLGGSGFFSGGNQPGPAIIIDEGCNDTYLQMCNFFDGGAGDHYIEIEGSSPLIEDSSFETDLSGALSVLAQDNETGVPSHPIVRQPTQDTQPGIGDNTFDNSTLNATGSSTITLEWWIDVYVEDPDGNPITGAPVWVEDRYNTPATPSPIITDGTGWARSFLVVELILHEFSVEHFGGFNVSSENNSVFGYLDPEATVSYSQEFTVLVDFSLIPNTPPTVSQMTNLVGIYSGLITITYTLNDPDLGDDGNMSIIVEYSVGGVVYRPAAVGSGSDPTTGLNNNVQYTFVWDSSLNLTDLYEEQVYIRIIPFDKSGPGTERIEGNFTVDNQGPVLQTGPNIVITNTTATITWTVNEAADASVGWGFGSEPPEMGDITDETFGTTGSTDQSVTLTGLTPGRRYSYVLYSEDMGGNKKTFTDVSSIPFFFETPIWIPLYKGWNMISFAPYPVDSDMTFQLSSIEPNYQVVQIYKSSDPTDPWKQWIRNKPFGNDLTDLMPEDGVWIKMKEDDILTVYQIIPTTTPMPVPIQIDLYEGWNFVAYPSVTPRDIDTVLSGIIYDMVNTYDAASGQWYWWDGSSGDLAQMECGRGYWIHVPSPSIPQNYDVPYV